MVEIFMPLHPERLAETFVRLCEIDSPSRREGRLAVFLKGLFAAEFNAEILEDDSAGATGSDTGNLVVRIGGRDGIRPPFFCNCHLDTVEPCAGVKVRRIGDTFTSTGPTVLGADDKAGIAMLIEMARCLKDEGRLQVPLEFVFTTCEEIGLLGAKRFDFSLLRASSGYALDSAGIDLAVIAAPAANHFTALIQGLAAHAGLHPENGINAIQLASLAVAAIPLGRLDKDSTANIGLITGGKATNIIPEQVRIEGEVRSHSAKKLARYTAAIEDEFRLAIDRHGVLPREISGPGRRRAQLEFLVEEQFPAMALDQDDPVLQRLTRAAALLRRQLRFTVAGGGSDANIFSAQGLPTAILGTGMTDVHTTEESITLKAMVRTTELLLALARQDPA
jgi:tripeptide aminopeptidase